MFQIEGSCARATCYASFIEDSAVAQVRQMCDLPFTAGCDVRIMPDAHAGAGCTIGTTMTVRDAIVPNVVGVDIGCGMFVTRLAAADLDMAAVDAACHAVPSGFSVWDAPLEGFDYDALRCRDRLTNMHRHVRSLGTLGGGNHFIEVDMGEDGVPYLIIHSGSRNLGKQVAERYQALAVEQRTVAGDFTGREGSPVTRALCWLEGQAMEDYLHDVAVCQAFARRSRELMAQQILQRAGVAAEGSFHTVHNYVDVDEMVLRKGAIAAHEGELVLIPLNMRDGCVLARGKGNPDWNFSAPHGAGRAMSRRAAIETIDMDAYRSSMEGIYSTCVCVETVDEAPMAYKDSELVLADMTPTVEVLQRLHPVYNFKATDQAPRRGR